MAGELISFAYLKQTKIYIYIYTQEEETQLRNYLHQIGLQ